VFGAVFFQPSVANGIGKKLYFEYSNIDGAPVQAVDSQREITVAEIALAQKNRPTVLRDPLGTISAGPDVSCIFQFGHPRRLKRASLAAR